MARFPDISPLNPQPKPLGGAFPAFPPAPGPGSVSFTRRPSGGATIDALMQRQKQAAAAQQQALQTPQTTLPGGLGQMLTSYLEGKKQYDAEQEEAASREALTKLLAGYDPDAENAQAMAAQAMQYAPDVGLALMTDAIKARRDAANQETFTPLTPEEVTQLGLDPAKDYQRSSSTGKVDQIGGGGITIGTGEKMSEGLLKDTVFYPGALSANMELEDLDAQLSSAAGAAGGALPGGNYLQTPEYRRAKTAGDVWIKNVLRKESGAVIGEEEMEGYRRDYLPQPGDDAATIAYKRTLRDQRTNDMRYGLESAAPDTLKKIDDEFARRRAARDARKKARDGGGGEQPEAATQDTDAPTTEPEGTEGVDENGKPVIVQNGKWVLKP